MYAGSRAKINDNQAEFKEGNYRVTWTLSDTIVKELLHKSYEGIFHKIS